MAGREPSVFEQIDLLQELEQTKNTIERRFKGLDEILAQQEALLEQGKPLRITKDQFAALIRSTTDSTTRELRTIAERLKGTEFADTFAATKAVYEKSYIPRYANRIRILSERAPDGAAVVDEAAIRASRVTVGSASLSAIEQVDPTLLADLGRICTSTEAHNPPPLLALLLNGAENNPVTLGTVDTLFERLTLAARAASSMPFSAHASSAAQDGAAAAAPDDQQPEGPG